jgi:PAS domain S-box-containing protein
VHLPHLVTFPADDDAFAAWVARVARELATDGEPVGPTRLQARLRVWYPNARVRLRPRRAVGGRTAWEVLRDGDLRWAPGDRWWTRDGVARLTFDEGGRFRAADDRACELAGYPPGGIVGRDWPELAEPEQAGTDDWLWDTLRTIGVVHSVVRLRRADGSHAWIEYRSERHPREPDVYISYWRPAAVVEPHGDTPGNGDPGRTSNAGLAAEG